MGIEMFINRLPIKSRKTKVYLSVCIYAVLCFLIVSLVFYAISSFFQTTISIKACFLLGVSGAIFIALRILNSKLISQRLDDTCDERFKIHYFIATDIAEKCGGFLMGIWMVYEYFVNQTFIWQLFVIMVTISLIRVIALRYYQKHH